MIPQRIIDTLGFIPKPVKGGAQCNDLSTVWAYCEKLGP